MQELLIQYFNKRWVRLHILLTLPFECYRCPASVAMWGNLCASTVPGYSCSSKSSKLTPSATRRRGKLPPLFIQEFRNFSLLLHSKIKKNKHQQKNKKKVKKQVGKRSYAAIFIYTPLLTWSNSTKKKVFRQSLPQTRLCRVTSLRTPWGMRKPRQGSERLPARSAPGVCCWHSLPGKSRVESWRAPVSGGNPSLSGGKPPAFNVLLMYWVAPRSVRNLCLKCVSGTAVASLEAKLQTKTSWSFGLLLPGHARAAANTSSKASG